MVHQYRHSGSPGGRNSWSDTDASSVSRRREPPAPTPSPAPIDTPKYRLCMRVQFRHIGVNLLHRCASAHSLPLLNRQMAQTSDKADLLGGIILAIATVLALLVANSPLAPHYSAILHTTGEIRVGAIGLAKSLEHWVNDGLM